MNTHTPTPWFLDCDVIRKRERGQIIAEVVHIPEYKANAAYIVKCVNSHEELVEALRELIRYDDISARDKARAALAKATNTIREE